MRKLFRAALLCWRGRRVRLYYTNWRGESRWRTVLPLGLRFGANQWHAHPQWLMDVIDLDRGPTVHRTFAVRDIQEIA